MPRTALIISKVTATPAGISLAWTCGAQSGMINATDLDILTALLAALVRRLLMLEVESIEIALDAPTAPPDLPPL